MNGLGINKASKNDKDTNILTPEEVALLRAHASDGTLTAEERETYSKHLEAMKKLMPDESKVDKSMPDESEVDVLGLRVARALITSRADRMPRSWRSAPATSPPVPAWSCWRMSAVHSPPQKSSGILSRGC